MYNVYIYSACVCRGGVRGRRSGKRERERARAGLCIYTPGGAAALFVVVCVSTGPSILNRDSERAERRARVRVRVRRRTVEGSGVTTTFVRAPDSTVRAARRRRRTPHATRRTPPPYLFGGTAAPPPRHARTRSSVTI